MLRVYGCIVDFHDFRLVLLAGVVCFLSCYTAITLMSRARQREAAFRAPWLAAAAAVLGCGVWATHFIAMLGFEPGLPVGYDIGATVISALIAVAGAGLGFTLAMSARDAPWGGAIIGLTIGAMHFIGLDALSLPAVETWDMRYVAAAFAIGIGAGAGALVLAHCARAAHGRLAAALALALGICALHFTGMAALGFTPDPTVVIPAGTIPPVWLAVPITAVALLIAGLGFVGSLADQHIAAITAAKRELEQTADQLRLALSTAASANQSKAQFLATMSHELRTPLNAIIGFSEILKEQLFGELGNPRYCEYAGAISESGTHLLALINDILDLSKLDAGRLALQDEPIDIGQAIHACRKLIEPQAKKAKVRVVTETSPGLPLILADERRARQVLLNLLSNAVKFTPEGGKVHVSAFRRGACLAIAVADTGIGMSASDIPTALERFGQIDSKLSRKYEGTGLGLPLSKHLIELHGGALEISSQVNIGTTVTIVFPAERILPARQAA